MRKSWDPPLEEWYPEEGFVCKNCRGQALRNPENNQLWGCKDCTRITWSPEVFFKKVEPPTT